MPAPQSILDRMERDEARRQFNNLVNAGREFCYFVLGTRLRPDGNYQPVIVVRDHPDAMLLDFHMGSNLSGAYEQMNRLNEELGISPEQATDIVASSIRAQLKATH